MEQKKETKAQLERRIKNALVFVPKDKEYTGVYFSDKGLRLEATQDTVVISTGYHRHVFNAYTSAGISRPYLYTKRVIEIALQANGKILDNNGYSYEKLVECLKEKDDKSEYNIVTYFSWYLYNIFSPLYSIGESEIESFLVYEEYVHGIARQSVLLSEKNEDVTNKCFIEKVISNIKDFTADIDERILFHKKTDEEVAKENIEAAASLEVENAMTQEIEK